MLPTSVIALFCDDIREEKSGAVTLVGVMGDNVSVPPAPEEKMGLIGVVPKLCVYVRIAFDVNAELGPIKQKIILPDGSEFDGGGIDEATVEQARGTREKGNPMAGLVSRFSMGGFPVHQLGRMTVEIEVGEQKFVAGFLNFIAGD